LVTRGGAAAVLIEATVEEHSLGPLVGQCQGRRIRLNFWQAGGFLATQLRLFIGFIELMLSKDPNQEPTITHGCETLLAPRD
jgi:hypothetical protein